MTDIAATLINFILYILASLIAVGLGGFFFLDKIKKWLILSPKVRQVLFAFFDFQDYSNLVRDSLLQIKNQKTKIQYILQSAVGRNEAEVLKDFSDAYNELDDIMAEFLQHQQEIEKKLFGKTGV